MALVFDVVRAKGKPDDNRRPGTACPFCDVEGLTDVLRIEEDRIWLKNKFRTLRDTEQTVLVESSEHDADLTDYEPARLHAVVRFAIACWDEMIESGRYRSVLMYRNHGPLSGGSLTHPHMQIVGLENEDGYAHVDVTNFEGIDVWKCGSIAVTVSTEPIMGFFEANVSVPKGTAASSDPTCVKDVDVFADAVQVVARYILNEHHGGRATSYNAFFYRLEGRTYCKLMPRWVVSPYFVGYHLAQVNAETTLANDVERLRELLDGLGA